MHNDDEDFDDEDLSDEEIEDIVVSAVTQLLNLAVGVAELQTTDAAAEEILGMCDVVAEYMGIERAELFIDSNPDSVDHSAAPRTTPIPGVIRTQGKTKFRVVDHTKPREDDQDDQTSD